MPELGSLPTKIVRNIIDHLDKSSTIYFAAVRKTTLHHVHMSLYGASLSTQAPTLPAARIAQLRHLYGDDLRCINQWMITYLANSDVSTSDWHAAHHSFQSLVTFEGCEVCEHVIFKYRMKKRMGPLWCLCPDRLKFYRRANRRKHCCNMKSGCLAEMWRTQVSEVAVKVKQVPGAGALKQELQQCGENGETKVDDSQARDEAKMKQSQISKQAESMFSSSVPVRRSQRLNDAAKGRDRRRRLKYPDAGGILDIGIGNGAMISRRQGR